MQLSTEQLDAHLAKALARVYAIHGDETLLALEAADAVRAAARKRGYAERQVLEAGRGFDWAELRQAGASLSLFGEKRIVELRLPGGKVPAAAADAIQHWCAQAGDDTLLLLTMPRPEGYGWWKAPWFAALDAAGVVVEAKTVERRALPRWLAQRLARQGQRAPAEVLEYLAERVEGNLLAAHQEVQKLALLAPPGELTMEAVSGAVASVARYDPGGAVEALLAGDLARFSRMLEGLRAEGEAPTFILFILSSALFALQSGERVFDKRVQAAVEAARRRLPAPLVEDAVRDAARIDRQIKGVASGDAWEGFLTLGLKLAGGSRA